MVRLHCKYNLYFFIVKLHSTYSLYYLVLHSSLDLFAAYLGYSATLTQTLRPCSTDGPLPTACRPLHSWVKGREYSTGGRILDVVEDKYQSTHKRCLWNSTGGENYSGFRVLHGNCRNNKKKKKDCCKRRHDMDYSDKFGKGYPTMRFLEIDRNESDNGDHFTTLIDFISFYPTFVPRRSNAAPLLPPQHIVCP